MVVLLAVVSIVFVGVILGFRFFSPENSAYLEEAHLTETVSITEEDPDLSLVFTDIDKKDTPKTEVPEITSTEEAVVLVAPKIQDDKIIISQTIPDSARISDTEYKVVVGSFKSPKNAKNRQIELERKNIKTEIKAFDMSGTAVYRLVAGSFENYSEAVTLMKRLKQRSVDAFVSK